MVIVDSGTCTELCRMFYVLLGTVLGFLIIGFIELGSKILKRNKEKK